MQLCVLYWFFRASAQRMHVHSQVPVAIDITSI